MAQLGILEGRMPSGARNRTLFGGTLASSRMRKAIGPALFGARVLDPEDMIAKIQAEAVAAGLPAATGANIGSRAVAAQYADQPFNVAAEIAAAKQTALLSVNAGAAAGRGRAADAAYAQAKSAALASGLSNASAEAIAAAAGQATAAGLSYDVQTAIRNATSISLQPSSPAPDPTASTPLSVLATQEQLRQYYEVPAAPSAASTDAPAPVPVQSPEDVLRSTYADTSTPAATSAAPAAKSFIVPVAALAAAWFFLKG